MSDTADTLILDLLEWMGPEPRPYADVLEAWADVMFGPARASPCPAARVIERSMAIPASSQERATFSLCFRWLLRRR